MSGLGDAALLLGGAIVESGKLLAERIGSEARELPRDAASVEPEWVRGVVEEALPGCRVVEVTTGSRHSGTTDRIAVRAQLDEGAAAEGFEAALFLKSPPPDLPTRLFINLVRLGPNEVRFYNEIAPALDIEVPKAYFAGLAGPGQRFALVLEDLSARGARLCEVADRLTADEAERAVRTLAGLHAAFWGSPRLEGDLAWLRAPTRGSKVRAAFERALPSLAVGPAFKKHGEGLVPEQVLAGGRKILAARQLLEERWGEGPLTVIHGDSHGGNFYEVDGVFGLLDWQLVQCGQGMRDVAYFLTTSLETDLRREREDELIGAYLAELRDRGVAAPSFGEAWEQYRLHALYAWQSAMFTAAAATLQSGANALSGFERASVALVDLESLAALDEVLGESRATGWRTVHARETMSEKELIHLNDLAIPRLPMPLHAFNALARPVAARMMPIDEAALLAEARRRAKLDDFGDESFRKPLGVLLGAIDRENESTPLGRFLTRELVVGLLVTRLRLQELERRHPEVLEEEVKEPLVIAGLPRTGTTHLHNLIAQDARLRSMPYWEGLEPIPPLDGLAHGWEGDPRIKKCAQALKVIHYAMPCFSAMHEITPDSRHEEIQLLAIDFRSMLFEVSYWISSYRDWYMATDQTEGYRFLARMLRAMQWLHGPRRWALKSPQHIEQLGPLMKVFPDARVVQTHRDPVSVVASLTTMVAYGQRMQRTRVDRIAFGDYWAERVEAMLRASVRDRHLVPESQVLDVRFDELLRDNLAVVDKVYALADLELDDEAREAVATYRDRNPHGRHGKVDYRLDYFGFVEEELRERLSFYSERFDVPEDRRRRHAA